MSQTAVGVGNGWETASSPPPPPSRFPCPVEFQSPWLVQFKSDQPHLAQEKKATWAPETTLSLKLRAQGALPRKLRVQQPM